MEQCCQKVFRSAKNSGKIWIWATPIGFITSSIMTKWRGFYYFRNLKIRRMPNLKMLKRVLGSWESQLASLFRPRRLMMSNFWSQVKWHLKILLASSKIASIFPIMRTTSRGLIKRKMTRRMKSMKMKIQGLKKLPKRSRATLLQQRTSPWSIARLYLSKGSRPNPPRLPEILRIPGVL